MRIPLLLALLSGCVSAPVPMRSVKDAYRGKAKCLLVFLPGAGDHAERFAQEGFLEAVRARGLSVDIVSAEATLGYYTRFTITERLEADVINSAGYAETWLVGVSLGGAGSLTYAQRRPGQVTGVLALSPWLGSADLIREIHDAGGLEKWQSRPSEDYERELWRWLQGVTVKGATGPELYVGWGEADRLATADALLGEVLPPERVFHSTGGHGWKTWRELFPQFLAHSTFSERCAP